MNKLINKPQPGKRAGQSEFRRRGPFPDQKELDKKLISACVSGRTDEAMDALGKGADPDARNREGKTALMMAAIENFHEIGRLLIESGADPSAVDGSGFTALSYSNAFGSKDMRKLLDQALSAA